MRVWDIPAGYLNRQSLLGEHRELHGIVSIILHQKKGYSKHPETIRWLKRGWALRQRHQQLAAEMAVRGYTDRSPVELNDAPGAWPEVFIDPPAGQFKILAEKYQDKPEGRIPLPRNVQQLWAQHKYSVMARDVNRYKAIGKEVANCESNCNFNELALELTELLRQPPAAGGIMNALLHMWGYVSDFADDDDKKMIETGDSKALLQKIQILTMGKEVLYLQHSTALSELMIWL